MDSIRHQRECFDQNGWRLSQITIHFYGCRAQRKCSQSQDEFYQTKIIETTAAEIKITPAEVVKQESRIYMIDSTY